jgi:hypothetical protein
MISSIPDQDQKTQLLDALQTGQIYLVKAQRESGFILCHRFYAEVIGDGALVGGVMDLDCQRLIPLGQASLVYPESYQERQSGYQIRQDWIELTQGLIQSEVPLQRARNVITMLERNFSSESIAEISDEVLGQIAGVLAKTSAIARQKSTPQPRPSPRKTDPSVTAKPVQVF